MAEPQELIKAGSLVLYRERPARVVWAGDRLEIELEDKKSLRVRLKDVELLHPGPLASLAELVPQPGEMRAAWEILAGSETTLAELSELGFGRYSPAAAWATWQFVASGRYFAGTPGCIRALSAAEVEQKEQARGAQEAEERAWMGFLERARKRTVLEEDRRYLKEVEPLAYGQATRSRLLRDLGKAETPENAHAFLLECGYWDETVNPYPRRLGQPLHAPDLPLPELPVETRRDLTGLAAYAIDDAGTDNPDDAISLEGDRVWVHVADPAALIRPGSDLDVEARGRGMTLHLPEGAVHFVPERMIRELGLGLRPISPALSFGIDLTSEGDIRSVEVVPALVRVERLSYENAIERMDAGIFSRLEQMMTQRRAWREQHGAINIELPEVKIKARGREVEISPILALRSRLIVEEAMILAGEAAARFGLEHAISLPFSTQEPPAEIPPHFTMAEMFAMRRFLRRSQHRTTPDAHSGLGVRAYAQATSPLRRSMDLVVHQQLRAFLRGDRLLTESDLLERIGELDAVSGALRQAEVQSEKHWTLVYLINHPGWEGQGVLVEKRGGSGIVIIPELALEGRVPVRGDMPLDSRVRVRVTHINLAALEPGLAVVE